MAADTAAPLAFALSADHRAILRAISRLPLPVTSRGVVAEITRFLLAAAPYLELAAESGAGTVNT